MDSYTAESRPWSAYNSPQSKPTASLFEPGAIHIRERLDRCQLLQIAVRLSATVTPVANPMFGTAINGLQRRVLELQARISF